MAQWIAPESPSQRPIMRVSDAEREQAAALLREHWLAGRLDSTEFDERSSEVWSARTDRDLAHALRELPALRPLPVQPAPGVPGSAVASVVLGVIALALFLVSFSFLSPLVLPLSVTAWGLGRSTRRRHGTRGRGQATGGMVLGIIGTVLSTLVLLGWAVFLL